MPYIKKSQRDYKYNETAGLLSYHMTMLVLDFLNELEIRDGNKGKNNYEDYATAIGAIELTKLELARRLIYPYEDKKIKENGDVY